MNLAWACVDPRRGPEEVISPLKRLKDAGKKEAQHPGGERCGFEAIMGRHIQS
jgi:hypothetical protein